MIFILYLSFKEVFYENWFRKIEQRQSVQIRLKRIQERQNKVSIKEAKGLFCELNKLGLGYKDLYLIVGAVTKARKDGIENECIKLGEDTLEAIDTGTVSSKEEDSDGIDEE